MAAVASAHPDDVLSIREQVSEEEWEARVNLAACYRLVDHYDTVSYTHLTLPTIYSV